MRRVEEAVIEGRKAFADGLKPDANPYDQGAIRFGSWVSSWYDGWDEAAEEAAERKEQEADHGA